MLQVQSESESTSPDEVELNSATEISTDSEFDHDEIIRETPKIFIDDTHLRKPTKVQMKSVAKYIPTSKEIPTKGSSYLQKYQQAQPPQPVFKPLVQVDPSLLISNRGPLQNPRPGDYLLNKTASTEGIASKKSLELKKRYLLGEVVNGNKIQKSGSTSVLDSRIRSFQSNISECQKLLNPGSEISPSMKNFLDRTKLGEHTQNELMRSATNNILNDLKVEITIQKACSAVSTDNEKENLYVNSKNELNKDIDYSDSVNHVLLESINKQSPQTPTNNQTVIESIDLVTPEKKISIIDLTQNDEETDKERKKSPDNGNHLLTPDSNKVIDLTCDSPIDNTIIEDSKPDVSKDAKQIIPDILGHIGHQVNINTKQALVSRQDNDEERRLLSNSGDEEKRDSPEKNADHFEQDAVQIAVPNIPWNKHKKTEMHSSTTASTCTSNSSSIEDIQHYILESTTSPETQHSAGAGILNGSHQVPRVEVHDSSGTLMQVDSLMIIDGKYIGDPEDLKYIELPEGVQVLVTEPETPEKAVVKTSEFEEEDVEPVTATPEPAECTVIDTAAEQRSALPEQGPPVQAKIKPANLKFDTKNENKIETLKALPMILEQTSEHTKAVKPMTLNLNTNNFQKSEKSPTAPQTPTSPYVDNDKTPVADASRSEDSEETDPTHTGQVLTETELSDWTAEDCISENFIDIEFVLNSNKGTMKRNNRKDKKRNGNISTKLQTINSLRGKTAPVAEFEGILKAIDIDDIEFMDTGSEGSCAETYSATNTALLQNRGYVEFIETPKHSVNYSRSTTNDHIKYNHPNVRTKRDEKLGIDYIEQGSYILGDNVQDLLKTPVNEPQQCLCNTVTQSNEVIMTQSLTDSSTLNDIDEDSLGQLTSNTRTANNNTTTEESEALTVVTSPLDSSPPKLLGAEKTADFAEGSTPSSSEKQPRSSQSTYTATSVSSNKGTPPRQSQDKPRESSELSYEEYVRALQQKITQISSARDSLGKQRRKSSRGDDINSTTPSTTTTTASKSVPSTNNSLSNVVHKVPEIPTLTRKLEEISKERNKQKDLIHDLVMDKLQSKKQLNAEKRLHRSRQRNLLTSGYSSGTSLSPTPKLAAATSTNDNICSNKAHYHTSTAANNITREEKKENIPLQKSATYVAAYGVPYNRPTVAAAVTTYKQRPFSEHINSEQLDAFERFKLSKTPSFSYALTLSTRPNMLPNETNLTPKGPAAIEQSVTVSTENLRTEARARARLKSNSELGLSPEEKMQLLRKRIYAEHGVAASTSVSAATSPTKPTMPIKELKISTSKSFNDLTLQKQKQQNAINQKQNKMHLVDFTSDPNLLASDSNANGDGECKKTKSGCRVKDPERRKSLIQSLSNFFHKNSKEVSAGHSATTERAETSVSATNSSLPPTPTTIVAATATTPNSDGGMFSRFRISPKQKEKSKDNQLAAGVTASNEHILYAAQQQHQLQHQKDQQYLSTNHQIKHKNNHKYTTTTTTAATGFSSSSPQLYVNVHKTSTADDQVPPPIPPLPLHYQRSDDENYANETREQKKQRAISKAVRQAELKRLRIAQEIQREQEEIEVQLKELEARGVFIEKELRGEAPKVDNFDLKHGAMAITNDEKLLKELLEIWRNITQLKKRDDELSIRQQELQLEHRHAQLKEELNLRLSCNKLDKSSADVAAEGAILNEMLEIVAKRASLRPSTSNLDLSSNTKDLNTTASTSAAAATAVIDGVDCLTLNARAQTLNESNI